MKPLIVDVRHLYPPSCTFEASVRTHALFFKLTLCPFQPQPGTGLTLIALFYIYIFTATRSFTKFSPLHAVCVPCHQPSPAWASTGDHPPTCAGDGRPRNIHRPCLRRKRDRRPWGSPTREKRRAPNRPQRSGVRACRHGATYRRAGPPDGRIRPARALSWTPLSLPVAAHKLVTPWHR